jgi:hypothetical protein
VGRSDNGEDKDIRANDDEKEDDVGCGDMEDEGAGRLDGGGRAKGFAGDAPKPPVKGVGAKTLVCGSENDGKGDDDGRLNTKEELLLPNGGGDVALLTKENGGGGDAALPTDTEVDAVTALRDDTDGDDGAEELPGEEDEEEVVAAGPEECRINLAKKSAWGS